MNTLKIRVSDLALSDFIGSGMRRWLFPVMDVATTSVIIVDEPTLDEVYVSRIPNEETLQALDLLEEEKGWLSFDDPEDLFEYLDNC